MKQTAKKPLPSPPRLRSSGSRDRDLQTANLSLNRIDFGKRKGQYQASNTLTVRLTDVPKAGEAVAAATAAGANVLSGPSLQIDDPEKANRGAYIAAYRAARTRAEAYAEAAGMTISRVLTIRDGAGQDVPYYEGEFAAEHALAPRPVAVAPSIRPGVSRTRVSVQVDFALEPK
jgi:uncharacterized protein